MAAVRLAVCALFVALRGAGKRCESVGVFRITGASTALFGYLLGVGFSGRGLGVVGVVRLGKALLADP